MLWKVCAALLSPFHAYINLHIITVLYRKKCATVRHKDQSLSATRKSWKCFFYIVSLWPNPGHFPTIRINFVSLVYISTNFAVCKMQWDIFSISVLCIYDQFTLITSLLKNWWVEIFFFTLNWISTIDRSWTPPSSSVRMCSYLDKILMKEISR